MTSLFLILIAVIILLSTFLNNLSSRMGIPTLLAFMLFGMLFANNGLWDMRFDNYDMAKETCTVALIFIMFYGGFGTRMDAVRPVMREATLLASAGVVLTAGLVGLFCRLVLGWDWLESMLFGSVISSTDAASVFSILRGKRLGLKNNTAPMLEMESGSNDPASYMLTVIFLSVMNGTASGGTIVWNIFAQLVFGAGCGFGIAKLAAMSLKKIKFQTDGFDSLFIFAVAIASYAIPSLIGGNGYLSAYIVGILLGNEEFRGKKSLVSFFDGVTGLMQVLIFFLLGLLARPTMLHKAILPALAIFVFLTFVARPATVFGLLAPFRKYPVKQLSFISFVGLRGAASIVFAIMAMVNPAFLQHDIFNIVFCLVLISIGVQGSLIPWAARKMDMVDEDEDVMKTFNDFSDGTDLDFGRITIAADSSWAGRPVKELNLPKNLLLVLVIRGEERIRPRGTTVLQAGDEVIVLVREFNDSSIALEERTVKHGSDLAGKRISELPDKGLIVVVQRGDENIIPHGNTLLEEGDRLVSVIMHK